MNKTIKFLDADRKLVVAEAEITNRNGFPEFTMSGEYNGSSGQCFDSVNPATPEQAELIRTWREWHLNGMNAGCPEQQEYLKECRSLPEQEQRERAADGYGKHLWFRAFEQKRLAYMEFQKKYMVDKDIDPKYSFSAENKSQTMEEEAKIFAEKNTDIINYLKKAEEELKDKSLNSYEMSVGLLRYGGKLTVEYKGELYTYGTKWIYKDLPEDFEDTLTDLMDEIERQYEEEKGRPVTEEDDELFNDFNSPETAHALALMFNLTIDEIEDIEESVYGSDNMWSIQGIDYLAGTDDEMDEAWDEELENYLDECVLPELDESMRRYFDKESWKEDAKVDGRGHALNRYDGGEEYYELNGTYYYAYRQ